MFLFNDCEHFFEGRFSEIRNVARDVKQNISHQNSIKFVRCEAPAMNEFKFYVKHFMLHRNLFSI